MAFEIWCQGGPFDNYRAIVLDEPPDTLRLKRDPFHADRVIKVRGPWPDVVEYERVPSVEQFERERIYYPVEATD